MKNRIYTLLCLLLLGCSLFAQTRTSRVIVQFENADIDPLTGLSQIREIPLEDVAPFLSYFSIWENSALNLQIRFSPDKQDWTEWLNLDRDDHNPEKNISELGITDLRQKFFQLKIYSETGESGFIECHFYNPGRTLDSGSVGTETEETIGTSRACPCPFPSFVGRSQWCPNNNCPPDPTPVSTSVTHLIVHHSAGTNNASDWSAIVRAIWDLHVNGNGWDDIGYNWLVDPNGKIYLGRGNDLLGAHFCGHNSGTMGVCVMGDFTNIEPTIEARGALKNLLSWKACDAGLDPLGSSLHPPSSAVLMEISGHRDGCATACPGDLFYPLLNELREATASEIIAGCSGLPGPTSLSAELMGTTTARLSWTDNTENEAGFLLERSIYDNQHYDFITAIDPDTETYDDPGLIPGATYFYRLRSFSETDTSAYSNEAFVLTAPASTDLYFNDQLVKITPNPSEDLVQVSIQNELLGLIEAAVTDVTGAAILEKVRWQKNTADASFGLDLGALPAGVYLLRLQMAGHQGVFRVVKL